MGGVAQHSLLPIDQCAFLIFLVIQLESFPQAEPGIPQVLSGVGDQPQFELVLPHKQVQVCHVDVPLHQLLLLVLINGAHHIVKLLAAGAQPIQI